MTAIPRSQGHSAHDDDDEAPASRLAAVPKVGARGAVSSLGLRGLAPRDKLVEQFDLPVLMDIGPVVIACEALDAAISHRKIVAFLGERGVGKTMAMDVALRDFQAEEIRRLEAEPGLSRRAVFRVESPRAVKRLEVLRAIYEAVTGAVMATKHRGQTIPEQGLLERFVKELMLGGCAALVFDEAERLSDEGLDIIRDIVNHAESRSEGRLTQSPAGETRYTAKGIGVVLLGTDEMAHRLRRWEESGRRLVLMLKVERLGAEEAAYVYRAFLPCCERQAQEIGDEAWIDFIRRFIASMPVSYSELEAHARLYVRRVRNEIQSISTVDEIPFIEEAFRSLWAERALPPHGG